MRIAALIDPTARGAFFAQTTEVALAELRQQRPDRREGGRPRQAFAADGVLDLVDGRLQLPGRIAEEQGRGLEGHEHQKASVGVVIDRRFLPPPNREKADVPPEQPLPSVKPQPPRMS